MGAVFWLLVVFRSVSEGLDADTDLPGIQEEVQRGLAEGTFLARSHSSLAVPGMEGPNPVLSPSNLNLRTCVLACWSAVFANNKNSKEILLLFK